MTRVVTASAGSGKTWRLTQLLTDAVMEGLPAEAIMATTFTVRAAQELLGRARSSLLQAGRLQDAQLLGAALIGTLHAIGARLLYDFAFELGMSPSLQVLSEEDTLFSIQEALQSVFEEEPYLTDIQRASQAFGVPTSEWQEVVRQLIQQARANRLSSAALLECGCQSLDELLGFLDVPQSAGPDEALAQAVEDAWARFGRVETTVQEQRKAQDILRDARHAIHHDRLRWVHWVRLCKIYGGKKWEVQLESVRQAAASYVSHLRLRADMTVYMQALYRFAARGMDAYAEHKRRLGLIDYGDQEEQLLMLLESPHLSGRVAARIQVLLVDEFQDTSPMQLAIFLRLAETSRLAAWVGDPKQAIYQFRGADPALMSACLERLQADPPLDTSYRSIPGLVHFVNRVFGEPFERQGVPFVPLRAARTGLVGEDPVVSIWGLETQNRAEDWEAIAAGLVTLRDRRVEDPVRKVVRPLQLGDVAILCRTREGCRNLAAALSKAGYPVTCQQAGLLETIEGRMAEAGLRLLVDSADVLAAATIAFCDRPPEVSEEDWLLDRLSAVRDGLQGRAWDNHPRVAALHAARPRAKTASPWEALDIALSAMDLSGLCLSFPQAQQRRANIEALRGHATAYEERCRVLHWPASTAGFIAYLHRLAAEGKDEGMVASGDDAVRVLTYHAAKGLEWPVVVLTELDHEVPEAWRGITVSTIGAFDMSEPLARRHVRYWFSPFERQSAGVPYLDRIRRSPVGAGLQGRAGEEALRLLYVGFTRARDHLVLALRSKDGTPQSNPWLEQALHVPRIPDGEGLEVAGVRAQGRRLHPGLATAPEPPPGLTLARGDACDRPAAVRAASDLEGGSWEVAEVVELGGRINTGPAEERDILGDAVHAFLAADTVIGDRVARHALAMRVLSGFEQSGILDPALLVVAGDRMVAFLATRYPGARILREYPLAYRDGDQEVWGQADLVIDSGADWTVIDHKTFEGSPAEAASRFGAQLQAYGEALLRASGRPVAGLWLHQALSGRMVRIQRGKGS